MTQKLNIRTSISYRFLRPRLERSNQTSKNQHTIRQPVPNLGLVGLPRNGLYDTRHCADWGRVEDLYRLQLNIYLRNYLTTDSFVWLLTTGFTTVATTSIPLFKVVAQSTTFKQTSFTPSSRTLMWSDIIVLLGSRGDENVNIISRWRITYVSRIILHLFLKQDTSMVQIPSMNTHPGRAFHRHHQPKCIFHKNVDHVS